ncbi:MAG: hypothetical protein NW218_19460 [Saprospiraceae bacterium]|nr:hypothetical protein [Saprospiraceae bacterium]
MHLFYFTWQLSKAHLALIVDELEQVIKNGEKPIFVYCDGELLPCSLNRYGENNKCKLCRFYSQRLIQAYKQDVTFISLEEIKIPEPIEISLDHIKSLDDLKTIEFNNVNLGYGLVSSYVSFTRNMAPLIDEKFLEYCRKILKYQQKLVLKFEQILKIYNIEAATLFNGRFSEIRPVFELLKNKIIDLICLELIHDGKGETFKEKYINTLPHSIEYKQILIQKSWDTSKNDGKAEQLGNEFFENRRQNRVVRDLITFTNHQKQGIIPFEFDKSKTNIAIFISSEDEFYAIGDTFDSKRLFKDQIEGCEFILKNFYSSSFHFYIRLHPNLKDVKYKYHTQFYSLTEEYNNVTIIEPLSEVSSYSLIDHCSKVISFGSTIGIEATYWGKPSILAGPSFYYYLGACYIAKSREELLRLIREVDIPFEREKALPLGNYFLNFQSYSTSLEKSLKKVTFLGLNAGYIIPSIMFHKNPFFSKLIEKIIEFFYLKILPSRNFEQLNIPTNEK